jgi:carboxylesterase
VVLEESYHVATLDNDAPQIFAGTVDFIRSLAPSAAQEGTPA